MAPDGGLRAGRQALARTIVAALVVGPPALSAQTDTDVAAAFGGAALGAHSGAAFGLLGALLPCNRTLQGARCARIATFVGGLAGSASGAVLAYRSREALEDRLGGAAWGSVAGAAAGYALKLGIREYGWRDVGAVAAAGAAFGASPVGAGIGFGVGAVVGTVLWVAVPDAGAPAATTAALVGMAIGGLADWVYRAAESGRESASFVIPFQIRF